MFGCWKNMGCKSRGSLPLPTSMPVATTSTEVVTNIKIIDLLYLLMRAGWDGMYLNFIALDHSTEPDMQVMYWILRGEINDLNCRHHMDRQLRAWLAVRHEFTFNALLHFLRKSNGDVNFADPVTKQTILHVFLRACSDFITRRRSLRVVKRLIKIGASVNARDVNDYTSLHIAAEKGDKALMKLILRSGFSEVHAATTSYGDTVLHDVIHACHKEAFLREDHYVNIVRDLIARGADGNARNHNDKTPTQLAVEYNCPRILQILQANGADFEQRNADGKTLLHLACKETANTKISWLAIVEFLLDHGCSDHVNAIDDVGYTPLHYAASLRCAKIIGILARLPDADLESRARNRTTPLHLAIESSRPDNVEVLLRAGADADAVIINGFTPLHVAAAMDAFNIVQCLIEHGADMYRRDNTFDFTPLHIAVMSTTGSQNTVEFLIRKDANVNESSRDGVTPLHLAALTGNSRILRDLCRRKILYKRATNLSWTPLHLAVISDFGEVRRIFHGMDLKNNRMFAGILNGFYWHAMLHRDYVDIVKCLVTNGISDVNEKDAMGRTPLHLATLQPSDNELIKTLLTLGAYVDEHDHANKSPMSNLLNWESDVAISYLLDFGFDINDEDMTNYEEQITNCHPLMVHAMKLKMLGLPVRDKFYNLSTDDETFMQQINNLKSYKIDDFSISIYDFLHMKQSQRRVNCAEKVMNINLELEFPEFAGVVRSICRQIIDRTSLLTEATDALTNIADIWLPDVCIERVLSYVNNRELRSLIASASL